ncbi:putative GTP-binding protein YPTM1 [Blattamonas nauphoetae]|uniref:GTP-binding protein YPTM1 n=1 Tax=Blattamonas nauphoetae TaxID=2049346 RepID=A0ABQ9XCT2_9EUKA|nr:putative GTP-binding protein YPTM1 [Blattamonas nauphoetae]
MVGKSSILMRYTDDLFSQSYIMSIGVDFKYKTVEVHGKKLKLQIWDTAGQDRFRTITAAYYRGAEGIIIVYSVNSRESFENIQQWLVDMNKHVNRAIPVILVGNKADLIAEREVPTELGKRYAHENGYLFIETSAKTGSGITELFDKLALEVVNNPRTDEQRQKQPANPNQTRQSDTIDPSKPKDEKDMKCCG